jgi:hypothetical protein
VVHCFSWIWGARIVLLSADEFPLLGLEHESGSGDFISDETAGPIVFHWRVCG